MRENPQKWLDELNVSRLNLISALDQIDGQREWSVTLNDGERTVKVTCKALPEHGIPHGLDNDVSAALINLYSEQGSENGSVEVSATELLKLCGFHRNGHYYAQLRESLERLKSTTFKVQGGWRNHPQSRWQNVQFSFIDALSFTSKEAANFDERTLIRVRLADEIVASIRGGYTKPLDLGFMQSLSRPRTRTLYRVLDAARTHPERPQERVDAFEIGLVDWANQCKISAERPDAVRRALDGPHKELVERGYLREVRYVGRGLKQRIFYVFTPDFTAYDPEVLERLRGYGVAEGVARSLTREHGTAHLNAVMDRFSALLSAGMNIKKTQAHALVHLIKNPDQYTDPLGLGVRVTTAPKSARKIVGSPRQLAMHSELPEHEEWSSLPLTDQAEQLLKRFNLLYPRRLSLLETDTLRQAVITGQLDAKVVLNEAVRRLTKLEGEAFTFELKQQLADLELIV